jgi:hypothetical protein
MCVEVSIKFSIFFKRALALNGGASFETIIPRIHSLSRHSRNMSEIPQMALWIKAATWL